MLSLPLKTKLLDRLHEDFPLIQVLLGPRQVGKSTMAQQVFDEWSGPKLMVSADFSAAPTKEWLRFQTEQALQKGPGTLFIVDEVQKVADWSTQIKGFFDQIRNKVPLKILLLGSSSLYMQKGLTESLAGRFEVIEATHWSWNLCQKAFGWDLNTFLKFGGYPGAANLIQDQDRWRSYIQNSIIEPVLGKDILGLVSISKPALFRQCFELVVRHPAQIISLTKLLGQLQDKGNTNTVRHYLELIEKCFLIKVLSKYSGSTLKSRTSPPKILVCNPALIHAYQSTDAIDNDPRWFGKVFESAVGYALSQVPNAELYYWREQNFEVDFVLKTPSGVWGVEIKSGLKADFTRGVHEFSKRFPTAHVEQWDFLKACAFLKGEYKPWG